MPELEARVSLRRRLTWKTTMTQKRLMPVMSPRMVRAVTYSEWLKSSLVVPQNMVTTIIIWKEMGCLESPMERRKRRD